MTRIEHRASEVEGVPMRSTLEARWATFFSSVGLKWQYEPETFELEQKRHYTPDFYVEDLGWIEIKPTLKHFSESWLRLKLFCRLKPDFTAFLFPGDFVGFRDVLRFHQGQIYRPSTQQMLKAIALIRHGKSKVKMEIIYAAINAAMQHANVVKISHTVPLEAFSI